MAKATISMPDELDREIESELTYGDSKSEWVRHAIKIRQHVDPILDECYESYQRDKRLELIEAAVRNEVDRRKNNVNGN